jgi:hypothetical protein
VGSNPTLSATLLRADALRDERAATLEVSMLMNIMPNLSQRVSADIRHNIAQDCQEPSVIAEQNNTFVPA